MRPCTVEAYLPQTHLKPSHPRLALDEGVCPLRPHHERPTYQEPTRLSIECIVTEAGFGFVSVLRKRRCCSRSSVIVDMRTKWMRACEAWRIVAPRVRNQVRKKGTHFANHL
jgi:hypothetical protein